jgi:hypothetical protein
MLYVSISFKLSCSLEMEYKSYISYFSSVTTGGSLNKTKFIYTG